jgi:hypothetical protein
MSSEIEILAESPLRDMGRRDHLDRGSDVTAAVDWLDSAPAEWETLASEHATPFYLFDADAVRRRIGAVRVALQGMAWVFYAVKANPNLGLLRAVRPAADGVDISSAGGWGRRWRRASTPSA